MKLTKEYLKSLISEILRLDASGNKEEFGPPEEIDAIYHDSTRDDNKDGYTSVKKTPLKVKIFSQKGADDKTIEVN